MSTAQHLRDRAWGARAVAARLESAPLLSLDAYAGADTWQCPAADEFLLCVSHYQSQLLGATENLRWQAVVLERQADEHEAAETAAVAAALAGAV